MQQVHVGLRHEVEVVGGVDIEGGEDLVEHGAVLGGDADADVEVGGGGGADDGAELDRFGAGAEDEQDGGHEGISVAGGLRPSEHLDEESGDSVGGFDGHSAQFADETLAVYGPELVERHLATFLLEGYGYPCWIRPFGGRHRRDYDRSQVLVGLIRGDDQGRPGLLTNSIPCHRTHWQQAARKDPGQRRRVRLRQTRLSSLGAWDALA